MGSYEVLVAAADRALYDAKNGGRDRVAVRARYPRPAPAARSGTPTAAPAGGARHPKLLVVDDDPAVVSAMVRMLKRAGFGVEGTDDPNVAIERYRRSDPPDVLITDIIMPVMNGLLLAERIASVRPGLKVIYMSGYVERKVNWAGFPGEVVGFVEKPVEMDDLVSVVQAVLAGEGGGCGADGSP